MNARDLIFTPVPIAETSSEPIRTMSLCAGIGGLDLALGHAPSVVAEIDDDCAHALNRSWPAAVNIGDWTRLRDTDETPGGAPDMLTAGLPCQPVSSAGSKRGAQDERWLFDDLARFLEASDSKPAVLLENVNALCGPKMERVMAAWRLRMSSMGYRLAETVLPAAAVGAPHKRLRWFALAEHPDNPVPADLSSREALNVGRHQPRRLMPTPTAADAQRGNDSQGFQSTQSSLGNVLLPTPLASDINGRQDRLRLGGALFGGPPCRPSNGIADDQGRIARHGWGPYQAAVDVWESVIGRPPPAQVQASNGKRLIMMVSPALTEWMMGFPDGWATERMAQKPAVKAIGNSVCPLQARLAIKQLMEMRTRQVVKPAAMSL